MIPYSDMTASQSSDYTNDDHQPPRGLASAALTADPLNSWPGTCTHTNDGFHEWWNVSFGMAYSVSAVTLTNRRWAGSSERLNEIDIYVANITGDFLCASNVAVSAGATKMITCVGHNIRSIHLQQRSRSNPRPMTLCGFKAYGEVSNPNDNATPANRYDDNATSEDDWATPEDDNATTAECVNTNGAASGRGAIPGAMGRFHNCDAIAQIVVMREAFGSPETLAQYCEYFGRYADDDDFTVNDMCCGCKVADDWATPEDDNATAEDDWATTAMPRQRTTTRPRQPPTATPQQPTTGGGHEEAWEVRATVRKVH